MKEPSWRACAANFGSAAMVLRVLHHQRRQTAQCASAIMIEAERCPACFWCATRRRTHTTLSVDMHSASNETRAHSQPKLRSNSSPVSTNIRGRYGGSARQSYQRKPPRWRRHVMQRDTASDPLEANLRPYRASNRSVSVHSQRP